MSTVLLARPALYSDGPELREIARRRDQWLRDQGHPRGLPGWAHIDFADVDCRWVFTFQGAIVGSTCLDEVTPEHLDFGPDPGLFIHSTFSDPQHAPGQPPLLPAVARHGLVHAIYTYGPGTEVRRATAVPKLRDTLISSGWVHRHDVLRRGRTLHCLSRSAPPRWSEWVAVHR